MADTWDVDTIDTASAISGFADVLDQAADETSSPREGGSPNVTAGDAVSLGGGGFDPSAGVPGGPESQPFSGGSGGGIGEVEGTINQEVDVTDLGDKPSLQAMQSAIESVASPTDVDATMGDKTGGPADMVADLMGEEEVAEEVAPGQQVADFLSDFNQGMSGVVGHPDWGMGTATPMSAEQAAATASGGGEGWNNPNTYSGQLDMLSARMDNLERWTGGLQSVQKGYPQPSLDINDYRVRDPSMITAEQAAVDASGGGQGWVDPNASFEDLEAQFSTSPQVSPQAGMWDNPNTAYSPLESPNYPVWQNPNTVRPPLEEANFPPDWYNVNEQRAYPTAMGGNLPPISAQEAAATATGGGQGWVDPNTPQLVTDFITDVSMDPQYQPQRDLRELISLEESEATTLAPQYSEESPGYQTHNQMYPGHRNAAAMAGVASIRSMFDGTHKAWIEAINKDMKDRDIVLDHAINGVRTGKHSSGNWKEYDALFTVGEDGVPRDSDGVAMPGTEKQAQAGIAGALQGLWGGILSGAEKFFQPSTSSGVEDPYANLGYPDYASGNIPANIRQPATVGDDTRGDNPIDIIRSNYAWASSLPNNVLFNAARYPDYLRLLIEYDAAGKDLPLTVPTWILEGTARPAEDEEQTANWIANHPTMQTQELTWT